MIDGLDWRSLGENSNTTSDEIMQSKSSLEGLTAQMVSAFLSNHNVAASEVPELIRAVHQSVLTISQTGEAAVNGPSSAKPAVPIKRSVTSDYIVCLEDGMKFKSLKRHLRTSYGMTPDEYRAKWDLPRDYPMVAPNYAEHRSQLAKKIGLGRQRASKRRKTV